MSNKHTFYTSPLSLMYVCMGCLLQFIAASTDLGGGSPDQVVMKRTHSVDQIVMKRTHSMDQVVLIHR